jgi:hypothetical protein
VHNIVSGNNEQKECTRNSKMHYSLCLFVSYFALVDSCMDLCGGSCGFGIDGIMHFNKMDKSIFKMSHYLFG